MNCPYCGKKNIGKIGRKRYFCSECYSEIVLTSNRFKVIEINEKGIPTVVKVIGAKS